MRTDRQKQIFQSPRGIGFANVQSARYKNRVHKTSHKTLETETGISSRFLGTRSFGYTALCRRKENCLEALQKKQS
ncbi:hypothetical protein J6590_103981 [Homalodisca vitripennis]|nr:hypothetical protein J6590_103981 [Homalodisca vitripennis]